MKEIKIHWGEKKNGGCNAGGLCPMRNLAKKIGGKIRRGTPCTCGRVMGEAVEQEERLDIYMIGDGCGGVKSDDAEGSEQ